MARTALGVVRQLYQEVIIVTFSYLLGCGMAAAIADRVLLSLGDEDDGGGGCQCHGIQQILFREEHQGFSGVRKM